MRLPISEASLIRFSRCSASIIHLRRIGTIIEVKLSRPARGCMANHW
jgi:hypothetical protein